MRAHFLSRFHNGKAGCLVVVVHDSNVPASGMFSASSLSLSIAIVACAYRCALHLKFTQYEIFTMSSEGCTKTVVGKICRCMGFCSE